MMFFKNSHDLKKQYYSRSSDRSASIAERHKYNLQNPGFDEKNAPCIAELWSVIKKYNNTIHQCLKQRLPLKLLRK